MRENVGHHQISIGARQQDMGFSDAVVIYVYCVIYSSHESDIQMLLFLYYYSQQSPLLW